jgi:hypothetical protein
VKDDGERNIIPQSIGLIAVGSIQFIERIKTAMGAMAKGRTIRGIKGGFELQE